MKVVVDDIDPQGKISLSLVGEDGERIGGSKPDAQKGGSAPASAPVPEPAFSGEQAGSATRGAPRRASFEDEFAAEIERDFGNLGPSDIAAPTGPRPERGPRRRGGPRR